MVGKQQGARRVDKMALESERVGQEVFLRLTQTAVAWWRGTFYVHNYDGCCESESGISIVNSQRQTAALVQSEKDGKRE
nr:hypothetical protein CFP56_69180 [Quercus suber]